MALCDLELELELEGYSDSDSDSDPDYDDPGCLSRSSCSRCYLSSVFAFAFVFVVGSAAAGCYSRRCCRCWWCCSPLGSRAVRG